MTINLNEINQRYNLIGRRLAAIEKESALLKKEQESLHILLELYSNNKSYYDIIKEEANITTALSSNNKPSSTPPTTQTKSKQRYNIIDEDFLLLILQAYGPQSAKEIRDAYATEEDVPYSTVRDKLQAMTRAGILDKSQKKKYSLKVKEKEE